jgi:hypothetical protein
VYASVGAMIASTARLVPVQCAERWYGSPMSPLTSGASSACACEFVLGLIVWMSGTTTSHCAR